MPDTKLIPADASFAAKRGFIRTTSQSIATALGAGITVALVGDAVAKAQAGDWLPLAISAGVTVAMPFINGAQSFFDILSRGIPADYAPKLPPVDAADGGPAVLPPGA
jgi:hypothetical protein